MITMMAMYLRVIIPFVWIGFVCAISFMEAWIKFTAPGVSLVTGLSIGKVVFSALNKVELTAVVLIAATMFTSKRWETRIDIFFLIAVSILFVQSLWILPALSARIDIYLNGSTPPSSSLHFYFIATEGFKVVALSIYGINQLKLWKI